jgi:hypothetical protein
MIARLRGRSLADRPKGNFTQRRQMAEIERARECERPPLRDNPYERSMRNRNELQERNLSGPVVVAAAERDW